MRITLLCNTGLAIEYQGQTLLIDLPQDQIPPFMPLGAGEWERILNREPAYDKVCGIFFTHNHPDHCDPERAEAYRKRWREIPVFLPEEHGEHGTVAMGPFVISYDRLDHAPMDPPPPPHVVTWIRAGSQCVYIAGDAKLDPAEHYKILKGRKAHIGFWNPMYLSRPETRQLIRDAATRSYIYHLPASEPDSYGIWKKCRSNQKRYGAELPQVEVLEKYPSTIE